MVSGISDLTQTLNPVYSSSYPGISNASGGLATASTAGIPNDSPRFTQSLQALQQNLQTQQTLSASTEPDWIEFVEEKWGWFLGGALTILALAGGGVALHRHLKPIERSSNTSASSTAHTPAPSTSSPSPTPQSNQAPAPDNSQHPQNANNSSGSASPDSKKPANGQGSPETPAESSTPNQASTQLSHDENITQRPPDLPRSFRVIPNTKEYIQIEQQIQAIYRGEIPEGVSTLEEIAQLARPTVREFKTFAELLNQEVIGKLPKELSHAGVTSDQLSEIAKILVAGQKVQPSSGKIKYTDLAKLQEEITEINPQIVVSNVSQGNGYFKLTVSGKSFGFKVYYPDESGMNGSFWNGAIMGAHFLPLQPFQDFYSLHTIRLPLNNAERWVLDEFIDEESAANRQGNSWIEYMKKVGINPSDHTFTGTRNRISGIAIDRDDIYFGFDNHHQSETGSMSIQEFKSVMNNPDPRVREEAYNLLIFKIPVDQGLEALQICRKYPEALVRICYSFKGIFQDGTLRQKAVDILKPTLVGIVDRCKSYLDHAPDDLNPSQVRLAKEDPSAFIDRLLSDSGTSIAEILGFIIYYPRTISGSELN